MPYFTAQDGAQIYFEDDGSGLPILCLSGLTRNSRDFDHMAPHLSARLIRMDYRGRGKSDWTGRDTYTLAQEARDALALLDHLDIPKAGVIGTSRGGLIAMGLSVTAPERLLGVALNDVGPELEADGLSEIMGYLGRRPPWRTREEARRALPAVYAGFHNVPDTHWQHFVDHAFDETDDGLALRYDATLREALLEAATPDIDMWGLFDGMARMPLALIWGVNSNLLGAQTVTRMRRHAPDMIVAEVPDRGHVPFLDEPPAVAALQAWQARLS